MISAATACPRPPRRSERACLRLRAAPAGIGAIGLGAAPQIGSPEGMLGVEHATALAGSNPQGDKTPEGEEGQLAPKPPGAAWLAAGGDLLLHVVFLGDAVALEERA